VHDALQKSTGIRAGVAAAKNRESSSIVSNVNVRVTNYAAARRLIKIKMVSDRLSGRRDPHINDRRNQLPSYWYHLCGNT
jgi:hypothetical protein